MRIGIDFGGTNIAVGIVDGNYRILYKTSAPTRLGRPVDEMVLDMAKLCLECAAKVGVSLEEVASVGIASPGVINSETARWNTTAIWISIIIPSPKGSVRR